MKLPVHYWKENLKILMEKFLTVETAPTPAPKLLFQEKLKENVLKTSIEDFKNGVIKVADNLKINPDFLMAVFELETASTFDPSITNSLGYTGLIQFGETAAKSIGTTTAKLRKMNAVEQLEYVEKYFWPHRKKLNTLTDVYFAVFFPVAIGRPKNWVLQAKGLSHERVAKWNPLFDINKDGKIEVIEVQKKLRDRLPSDYKHYVEI